MNKILVVEDDNFLRRDLKEILEKNGYEVIVAATVAEAVHYIDTDEGIELYLIDIWLPDGEGFMVCEKIRKRNLKPIIFLSVCDDEEYIIKGLNIGGDDYVIKPFRTRELISRIEANLRRFKKKEVENILKSDHIIVDLITKTVTKDGMVVKLTPIEYLLLVKLMENAERIVKREQLHMSLWDSIGDEVEDNTLSVNISRLRSKIGIDYIETIRGFGYRYTQKINRMF